MENEQNYSNGCRYYCHTCNTTVSLLLENFICPHCQLGFIEKLPDVSNTNTLYNGSNNNENREEMDAIPVVVSNVLNDLANSFELIYQRGESATDDTNENRPSSSNSRQNNQQNRNPGNIERYLSEFLSNVSRTAVQNLDNSPVLFFGNPADYVWGREGLDSIVTQLLNQMDSSGPPPLAKEKIKELPFVSVTAKQVSENIQCSVCWDSFKVSEYVRQLPCEHIYHDICIVPWLELHGTCPICRKILCEDSNARLGFPYSGGLEALLRFV